MGRRFAFRGQVIRGDTLHIIPDTDGARLTPFDPNFDAAMRAFARTHRFPDGNKRVALSVIDVFLQMNGRELLADEVDAANTMQSFASGDISEEELAACIEANS